MCLSCVSACAVASTGKGSEQIEEACWLLWRRSTLGSGRLRVGGHLARSGDPRFAVAALGCERDLGRHDERPGSLRIEDGSKHARRAEIGQAHPVQRSIARHQGHRPAVPDGGVPAKRCVARIAHRASVVLRRPAQRASARCAVPFSRRRRFGGIRGSDQKHNRPTKDRRANPDHRGRRTRSGRAIRPAAPGEFVGA